ncbi:DUF1441 family protein [Pseudoalteromonas sp. MMG024]|uniref:DUF1441 family protein n=1 Tax=Pseudoalteromonas sp. MMG024 TaxID=2909980 RepID=UPI001F22E4B7|nr:DUF1441 family protein [Pseudoalteromonas sp. MMG024]MCF6459054.1 DUF1441 family protein [Pseudoalteromonas sp. MMG024]
MSVSSIDDAYLMNISSLSRAFDLHRDTVRKRLNAARVKPIKKIKSTDVYALADVGPALFGQEAKAEQDDIHDPSKMAPKDRKDFFQSERERLKFETEIGELIPEPHYQLDLSETLKKVVSFFESMPDKMERKRVFKPEQLEQLETMSDEFRNELYLQLLEINTDDVG